MTPPLRATRYQQAVACTFACYDHWRDHLDDDEWRMYVGTVLGRWTNEAERLAFGDFLREFRKEPGE